MYKRKNSFYLIVYTYAEGVRRRIRKYCFLIKRVVKKKRIHAMTRINFLIINAHVRNVLA